MSGDRLSVDLDGLDEFASNLESVRARMNATRSMLDSHSGQLGAAEVETALDSFESNWSDGRKKIDDNAGRLAAMATEASKGLRQADRDLAAELTTAGDGGGE